MNDSNAVRKILSGNPAAGERFIAEHYPRIYRFLCSLVGSPDAAQDLTQQTFVKAWQALASFKNQSQLVTWLHRIAYHEYTHWLRDRREHLALDTLADIAAPPALPTGDTFAFNDALAKLSAPHRETFLLFHVQQLSVSEVAEVLQIADGTVKSRLFAARQQLRELLTEGERIAPAPLEISRPEPRKGGSAL